MSDIVPSTGFFITGGTLRPDAPSYVERKADHDLLDGLLQGQFCYVLTSRQMGKSSLMVRTAARLREQGVQVVVLDLTAIGQNLTPEQWYDGMLARMAGQLGLEEALEAFWATHPRLSPVQRLFQALNDVVLKARSGPVVVFVDEIDVVRSLPFSTDEFFAAIRELYNRRTERDEMQRVSFCLLGVAAPSDLIRDTRMTPFNVGRRIELNDFTPEEAAPLARGLAHSEPETRNAQRMLRRVLHWTSGHPYLTQRLCQRLAARPDPSDERAVDAACDELFLSRRAREQDDNLLFVRDRMLRNEADRATLLHLYDQVLTRGGIPDDETQPLLDVLRLAGIVRQDRHLLRVRNRIYARIFDRAWVSANMPDAEQRRQREAYRRGVVRATGIAAGVLLSMAALTALALWSRHQAQEATWTALRHQARLSRASALAGQRFEALESIRQAARIRTSPELRNEAIACLALPDLRKQSTRVAPEPGATALVFSEDLDLYAFSNGAGEVAVRRVADNSELSRWRASARAADRLRFSPDQRHLAVAASDGGATVISVWDCASGRMQFAATNRMGPEAFDFRPDGGQVAIGNGEGMVQLRSLPGGAVSAEMDTPHSCSAVRFDPAGGRLAIASASSLTLGIYDALSATLIRTLHSPSPVAHLAWHPHGQRLAGAGEDRRIRLWELDAGEFPRTELLQHPDGITALSFSHAGHLLASAAADRTVRLWEAGRGRLLLASPEPGQVGQLQFSRDDRRLGYAAFNHSIQFWEVAAGEECRTLPGIDADEVNGMDIHPDGRLLAAAHPGGVILWDLARARTVGSMPAGTTADVQFDPVSGDLVSAEFRGTYRFSVEGEDRAGQRTLHLKPKEDFYLGPGAVALDLAGGADVLAVAYPDRIRLAKNTNSAYGVVGELLGETGFRTVAVSPDGAHVAAGNWTSGDVWLWDRRQAAAPRRLPVQGRARVRFSPQGHWLATGTERHVTLWDAASGRLHWQIERPTGATRPAPIAFAENGRVWALAWSDTRVRLMELDGGVIADLEAPHKELLAEMTFSRDGSRLACATAAGNVLAWDLAAVSRGLAQLGLDADLLLPASGRGSDPPLVVQIDGGDRLRLSPARSIIGLRREIGELTSLIQKQPDAWHLYRYRAEKWQKLSEFDRSIQDYRRWIELDRAAMPPRDPKLKAWPLRDLARVHLFGPPEVRDHGKAFALTEEALQLDAGNPDNHFRHGIACFRLGRFQEAQAHLEDSRRLWEASGKAENVATVLFYEAMCQANQKQLLAATRSLEQAKATYARTDLKYRESRAEELSELLWEAERVIAQADAGG